MNDHGNGTDETPPEPGSNVAGTPANPDERPRPDTPAGASASGEDASAAEVGPGEPGEVSAAPDEPSAGSTAASPGSSAGNTSAAPGGLSSGLTVQDQGSSTGSASAAPDRPSAGSAEAAPSSTTENTSAAPGMLSAGSTAQGQGGSTGSSSDAPGRPSAAASDSSAGNAPTTPGGLSASSTTPAPSASPENPSAVFSSLPAAPGAPADEQPSAGAHAAIPPVTPEEQTGPIARVTAESTTAGASSTPYGSENLLPRQPATPADPVAPPGKARRSPWNRRRDRVIAGAIVVVVAVVAAIVAATSDNLHTSRALADPPHALPSPPTAVPGSMTQLWQAPSSATPIPIGQSDTVTTADGSEVAGRDPLTGQIRWHYTRENLQLCTVDTAWGRINAVYHKTMGCSEVTQLDPATGRITAQRNGDAELGTRLVNDGSHVTTTGKHLLDTWRDDLVKSMEYGKVPFLQNANKQPRPNCTYGTVAAAADKIGVIERCPGDRTDRLTVYKATAEHEDEPKVTYTALLAGKRARVLAMSGDLTGVLLPDQKLYVVYGADGSQKAAYPMDLPASDVANDPVGGTEATTRTAAGIYWYSGSKTVALSRDDLSPRWTLDGTLGPGITFATQLVVPIRGGLAVLNETNGATLRTVGVDRGAYTGPVRLTALGPVLLEQRGPNVVALR